MLKSKVVSLAANAQPAGPGLCTLVKEWPRYTPMHDSQDHDGIPLIHLHTGVLLKHNLRIILM
jgi:hypothetical protein